LKISKESYAPLYNVSDIESLVNTLSASDRVAVDTEFLREKTYYAHLCLVQLQAQHQEHCVDTIKGLEIESLEPLLEVFSNPKITKVFHAARQDIEVILTSFGVLTTPIFDTQLAAAFCGSDMQIGYSALVQQELGITLPKSQARTDWSKRPLSDQQIEYALCDVRYLFDLQDIFAERLDKQDKLDWFNAEQALSYDAKLYEVAPENAYKRLSGGNMAPTQQYLLKELAAWREQLAIAKNLPRSWILKDKTCYDIAENIKLSKPVNSQSLDRIEGNLSRLKSDFEQIVEQALKQAEDRQFKAIWKRVEPLTKAEKSLCSSMMNIVKSKAKQLEVAQGLLATRKDIESLYRYRTSAKLLNGWRKEVIGERLLDYVSSN
jgi:ribonuclease D